MCDNLDLKTMCDNLDSKTKEELIDIIEKCIKPKKEQNINHKLKKIKKQNINHELKKIKERQRDQINTLNRYNKKSYELYEKQKLLKSMI